MTREEILSLEGEVLDAAIAERVMGLKHGVDFGVWPEHDWTRDEDGEIDWSAYEYDYYNGAKCQRCNKVALRSEHLKGECRIEPSHYSRNWWSFGRLMERWAQIAKTNPKLMDLDIKCASGVWVAGEEDWLDYNVYGWDFKTEHKLLSVAVCRAMLVLMEEAGL
jgi:hypothetical protein